MKIINKPKIEEFNPYFEQYINLVRTDNLIEELENSLFEYVKLLNTIPIEKGEYKYAVHKWTIKELIVHCIDTERIFQFRALSIARNDKTNLPGFDEDLYALNSKTEHRTLAEIVEDLISVRKSTISLFKSFDFTSLDYLGNANNSLITPRACGYIICGHLTHHINILKERY